MRGIDIILNAYLALRPFPPLRDGSFFDGNGHDILLSERHIPPLKVLYRFCSPMSVIFSFSPQSRGPPSFELDRNIDILSSSVRFQSEVSGAFLSTEHSPPNDRSQAWSPSFFHGQLSTSVQFLIRRLANKSSFPLPLPGCQAQ